MPLRALRVSEQTPSSHVKPLKQRDRYISYIQVLVRAGQGRSEACRKFYRVRVVGRHVGSRVDFGNPTPPSRNPEPGNLEHKCLEIHNGSLEFFSSRLLPKRNALLLVFNPPAKREKRTGIILTPKLPQTSNPKCRTPNPNTN